MILSLLTLYSRNFYMKISGYHLFIILFCCICTIFFAGCTGVDRQSELLTQTGKNIESDGTINSSGSTWMTTPITDAVTGENTSVADLIAMGKPVIIHTFAVWCPACSMQLRETTKVVKGDPDAYTVLGIDIDPRENTEMVKRHIEKNGFVGMYVASPPVMTRSLIDTFGNQIIQSLPQTIVICNKSVTYVGNGVFPEAKLKKILAEIC